MASDIYTNSTNSEWVPPMPLSRRPPTPPNYEKLQQQRDAIRKHNERLDNTTPDGHIHD